MIVSELALPPLQLAAISFALSQLVLSALLLAGSRNWVVQQRIYAVLLLAITCYLLDPLFSGPLADFSLAALTVAVPGMFWLFSTSLFDDHFRLQPWHIGLVAATVVPPLIGQTLRLAGIDIASWLLFTLPQVLEFILLALTLYVVLRHWRSDLIESRRRLRLWFCGLNGLYIFILLLFREVFFVGEQWLNTLQFIPVGGILLATNAILLVYRREIWPSQQPSVSNTAAEHGLLEPNVEHTATQRPVAERATVSDGASDQEVALAKQTVADRVSTEQARLPDAKEAAIASQGGRDGVDKAINDQPGSAEVDPQLMAALDALIEGEKIYREMGLTIGQLAAKLDMPEYRLRQFINAGLGYRNFNDFLNQFRVREASERLSDPAQQETQVLVIALDAGFRSLSSFNKAFKSTYDVTPTAYRKQQLAQSSV